MRYSNRDLEEFGVAGVTKRIWQCPDFHVSASINDKTLLVDGTIEHRIPGKYSDSKRAQLALIHIQIKATSNLKLNKKKKYNGLNRETLEAADRLYPEGYLLFVVHIENGEAGQIYYRFMTRIATQQILRTSPAKKPLIRLHRFPQDGEGVRQTLKQAFYDLTADKLISEPAKGIKESEMLITKQYFRVDKQFDLLDALSDRDVTLYKQIEGGIRQAAVLLTADNSQPFIRMGGGKIGFPNGDVYPFTRILTMENGERLAIVSFGSTFGFSITLAIPSNKITLKVKIEEDLADTIEKIHALGSLFKEGYFSINGTKVEINNKPTGRAEKNFLNELTHIEKLVERFIEAAKKTNINYGRFDSYNEDTRRTLTQLLDAHTDSWHKIVPFVTRVGSKKFLLYIGPDGAVSLYSAGMESIIEHVRFAEELTSGKTNIVNPYTAIPMEIGIEEIGDFNFELVMSWFEAHPETFKQEESIFSCDIFAGQLIKAFDNTGNHEYLRDSKSLLQLLNREYGDTTTLKLTRLQIEVRENDRRLKIGDQDWLIHQAQSSEEGFAFIASVLLQSNPDDLRKIYSKLNSDERLAIQQGPIWNLVDKKAASVLKSLPNRKST
jgi:hypothetical protein